MGVGWHLGNNTEHKRWNVQGVKVVWFAESCSIPEKKMGENVRKQTGTR